MLDNLTLEVDRWTTHAVVTSGKLDSSEDGTSNEGYAGEEHAVVQDAPVVDGSLAEGLGQGSSVSLIADVPDIGVKSASVGQLDDQSSSRSAAHLDTYTRSPKKTRMMENNPKAAACMMTPIRAICESAKVL